MVLETPYSTYKPSEQSLLSETEDDCKAPTGKDLLNTFLHARDISLVRHQLKVPWHEASDRTKRRYTRKAREVAVAALEEIAPQSPEELLCSIQTSNKDNDQIDGVLMEALVECYNNAGHWSTRREIINNGR